MWRAELLVSGRLQCGGGHMELLSTAMDCATTAAFLQSRQYIDYEVEDGIYKAYLTWVKVSPEHI